MNYMRYLKQLKYNNYYGEICSKLRGDVCFNSYQGGI